jgi:uridine kinase
MNKIKITLQDGKVFESAPGIEAGAFVNQSDFSSNLPCIGVAVNNDIAGLTFPLTVNSELRFLTMADPDGWRIYFRSLCFLLAKAIHDLFPDAEFLVEHSFGTGLYCSFHLPDSRNGITQEQLSDIEVRMHALVQANRPIERNKIAFMDAYRLLEKSQQNDKLLLLQYRNPPRVVIHECDGFYDLSHGPLVAQTGVLSTFKLIHYPPGFVLNLPTRVTPSAIAPFEDQPHLFQIFKEHKEWGRILGVTMAGQLNRIVATDKIADFIFTAEALHEKKISRIADQIAAQRGSVKVVLIAGPSSAGKTTFAKRLTTHLRVNGLQPITMGTDDYFVGVDKNPRDESGAPDYEHINAVDLALFNQNLLDLINGHDVQLPRFDFETQKREYRGEAMHVADDQIIIIEGIHGLNPALTHMIPAERKFKIYVNALTQLNLDSHNRIATTDNRLLRRMVRDHQFRGHSALQTLRNWPSVRKGEERWIFPFQREANATFNSALDYEMAILKPLAEPLLTQIKPSKPEYGEARRLTEFLLNFIPCSDRYVPGISILREYIGRSSFRY